MYIYIKKTQCTKIFPWYIFRTVLEAGRLLYEYETPIYFSVNVVDKCELKARSLYYNVFL